MCIDVLHISLLIYCVRNCASQSILVEFSITVGDIADCLVCFLLVSCLGDTEGTF